MIKHIVSTLLGAFLLTGSVHGQISNGNFSTGLAGWTSTGDVGVRDGGAFLTTADIGETPNKNFFSANTVGSFGATGLEGFSSLVDGRLDPDLANSIVAFEGSALKQSGTITAGSAVSFQWRFYTDDLTGDPNFSDYAYVVIDDGITPVVFTLATTLNATGSAAFSYNRTTNLATFNSAVYLVDTPITLSFGVVDVGDLGIASALSVDNVAIPEPSTVVLLGLAGMVCWFYKRRRSSPAR